MPQVSWGVLWRQWTNWDCKWELEKKAPDSFFLYVYSADKELTWTCYFKTNLNESASVGIFSAFVQKS